MAVFKLEPSQDHRRQALLTGDFGLDVESRDARSLVGWWPLGTTGDGATLELDKSLSRNNGTKINGPTRVRSRHPRLGVIKGLSFDETDDAVNLGDVEIHGNAITITAEIFTLDISSASPKTILSKRSDNAPTVVPYGFDIANLSGDLRFYFRQGGIWYVWQTSGAPLNTNTWYHVATTYVDGVGATFSVNGALEGSSQTSGSGNPARQQDNSDASIGAWIKTGVPQDVFDGTIANVRAYTRALSASEIAEQCYHPERLVMPRGGRRSIFIVDAGVEGSAAATGSASGTITQSHSVSGGASASATAQGTATRSVHVSAAANASATALGSISQQHAVAGQATASGVATGAITVGGTSVTGAATATGSAAGSMTVMHSIVAQAIAAAAASATLTQKHALSGQASATGTASGSLLGITFTAKDFAAVRQQHRTAAVKQQFRTTAV